MALAILLQWRRIEQTFYAVQAPKELIVEKSELLNWLRQENEQWEAFLGGIDPTRMEEPGVCGHWSMKDIVAHHAGWQRWLLARVRAAQQGKPEPLPPWPAELEEEDDINAWIYEANRARSLDEVLNDCREVLSAYYAAIERLPDDVQIEREWRVVTVGDMRFAAGEFFDHFHDDHEPEIRAWLAQD